MLESDACRVREDDRGVRGYRENLDIFFSCSCVSYVTATGFSIVQFFSVGGRERLDKFL